MRTIEPDDNKQTHECDVNLDENGEILIPNEVRATFRSKEDEVVWIATALLRAFAQCLTEELGKHGDVREEPSKRSVN